MVFKYFEFPLLKPSQVLGTSILRPIIPIKISSNGLTVKYDALIDSGADFCIFHAEIGEYWGLNLKSGLREIFSGVEDSAGAEAYFHELTLIIGETAVNTLVGFSYDIADHGYGLLGQKGLFEKFLISFNLLEKEIELRDVFSMTTPLKKEKVSS